MRHGESLHSADQRSLVFSAPPVRQRNPSAEVPSRLVLEGAGTAAADLGTVWIIEEVAGHLRSQNKKRDRPRLQLYRLSDDALTAEHELDLEPETDRGDAVLALLALAKARSGVLVCSYRTAPPAQLVRILESSYPKLHFVVEIDPARPVEFQRARGGLRTVSPRKRAAAASWQRVTLSKPAGASVCFAAGLGKVCVDKVRPLTCFALSIGGIQGYLRGIVVGLTSLELDEKLKSLTQLLAWTRWIRVAVRKAKRTHRSPAEDQRDATRLVREAPTLQLLVRANRRVAADHDVRHAKQRSQLVEQPAQLRRRLAARTKTLNVVELFAGAGGMGIGFLNARTSDGRGYRISATAEINPIYAQTLKQNHAFMEQAGLTPAGTTPTRHKTLDLCSRRVRQDLDAMARENGDVDVLLGGPPCQGFSSANRNSWSSSNPNNQLVDAFLDCVSDMAPRVVLMENVQGILWTPRSDSNGDLSVAAHVRGRLARMGYLVFPKLLDAVWYGVPQNRNRFFLLGLHKDVGYKQEEFGHWGPYPKPTHGPGTDQPFVTVREALADLPELANGAVLEEHPYEEDSTRLRQNSFLRAMRAGAPTNIVWDHVTSKHAEYVIDRYKGIRQGQNWQAVRAMMTNYADVDRTHSNIYRRLAWNEPAITIGHYRKSMIIHPSQNRGLSLREAARLQSFQDWFRFAGSASEGSGGLMHKQQQLANAVCPIVTQAVAEFILEL